MFQRKLKRRDKMDILVFSEKCFRCIFFVKVFHIILNPINEEPQNSVLLTDTFLLRFVNINFSLENVLTTFFNIFIS